MPGTAPPGWNRRRLPEIDQSSHVSASPGAIEFRPNGKFTEAGLRDIAKRCRSATNSLAEKRSKISEIAGKDHALSGVY
jgi:hypothetical protein